MHGRTNEESVRPFILEALSDGKARNTAEIRRAVKLRLPPTDEDAMRANFREAEAKYDAIIANALQAKRELFNRGFVNRLDVDRFQISAAGLEELARHAAQVAAMSRPLDGMYSEDMWK